MAARASATSAFFFGLTITMGANAAPCDAEPKECGRRAFDAGVKAFQAREYDEALEHFRQAYSIQRHPVVTYNLALAEAEAGLVLEALEHFRQVESDPNTSVDLKQRVEADRIDVEARIARVEVEVPGATDVRVTVDGNPVADARRPIPLNPGAHAVQVLADGKVVLDRPVQLAPGERVTLSVDRSREVLVGAESNAAPAGPAAPADRGVSDSGWSPTWFYVAAGATAALGGVTIWSAVDTKSAKDTFDRRAPTLSRDEAQRLLDDGHDRERRTNILLGVSGAAAVATAAIGIFAIDWSGGEAEVALVPSGVLARGRF